MRGNREISTVHIVLEKYYSIIHFKKKTVGRRGMAEERHGKEDRRQGVWTDDGEHEARRGFPVV